MKNNLTNELYCSTFGHNFYHSKSIDHSSDELICKHCNTKVVSDVDSDLDKSIYPKREFRALLLQLYVLKKPSFFNRVSFKL